MNNDRHITLYRRCAAAQAILMAAFVIYLFILPGIILWKELRRPDLYGPQIPSLAWRMHRTLTPRIAAWARARIESGKAAHLPLYDVPSTEWPMFGCVFYLMATESLQDAWKQDPSLAPEAPATYARDAIRASLELIIDPVHHTWVRQHWGENYLHRENVFFRGLIIAGLTSYQSLTGDAQHLTMLRDQADSLARELDASPFGILNDYPAECYPIDVLATIAFIRQSDRLTGLDHAAFVARSRRAFEGRMLDAAGLPPFAADPVSGGIYETSRGVGNSWIMTFMPELWPDLTAEWYRRYERHFWEQDALTAGFREFPPFSANAGRWFDVDAGPIIAGYSPAANAFALGAARACGRLDHVRILTPQILAACWPLPDGTLLGARILSNAAHAPHLGESGILYFLTRRPAAGVPLRTGGYTPRLVALAYWFFLGFGALILIGLRRQWRRWRSADISKRAAGIRLSIWFALMLGALALLATGRLGVATISGLIGIFCFANPRRRGVTPSFR
jgi:hypothetical protein